MSNAKVYHEGDAEPGEEVRAVRFAGDNGRGVLFKHDTSWGRTASVDSGDGRAYDWRRLLRDGDLVDATHENPPPLSAQILDRLVEPQTPEEQSIAHDTLRTGIHGLSYRQLQQLADKLGIER